MHAQWTSSNYIKDLPRAKLILLSLICNFSYKMLIDKIELCYFSIFLIDISRSLCVLLFLTFLLNVVTQIFDT